MTHAVEPGHRQRSNPGAGSAKGNRAEQIINALATSVSSFVVFLVSSGIAFIIFVALWVAFGAGLIWNQGGVDAAWQWIRDLPLLVQAVVWLLFLPVVMGLWIWDTSWPLLVRLLLVGGLAAWSVMIFLPRAQLGGRP
jgi:hypothetical protein